MKTTLTKTFTQLDRRGFDQSELLIKVEVEIDRREHTAEFTQLISVHAYDCKTKVYTDLTAIFFDCFHDQAEAIINAVDWWEVYYTSKKQVA
jgi:hypothetical protein